jgi:hypothetical protein
MKMTYNFAEQYEKGKKYEKHFFNYLQERNQQPKYNNFGGDNADFDIEANGKKYEVKTCFYPNNDIPIEICHAKIEPTKITLKLGWLLVTKADFIVFYKPEFSTFFILHFESLYNYVRMTLLDNKFKSTRNTDKLTGNFLYNLDALNDAGVIKKIEHFLE